MKYYKKVAIWLDQGINVIFFGGFPDESLSARAWRWHNEGKREWPRKLINKIFFWMKDHCYSAYQNEVMRRQYPPQYRKF